MPVSETGKDLGETGEKQKYECPGCHTEVLETEPYKGTVSGRYWHQVVVVVVVVVVVL